MNENEFISFIYLEISVEHKTLLDSVVIYETYHPGALVAFYAYDYIREKWIKLWTIFDKTEFNSLELNLIEFKTNRQFRFRQLPAKISRKFRPELTKKNVYSE